MGEQQTKTPSQETPLKEAKSQDTPTPEAPQPEAPQPEAPQQTTSQTAPDQADRQDDTQGTPTHAHLRGQLGRMNELLDEGLVALENVMADTTDVTEEGCRTNARTLNILVLSLSRMMNMKKTHLQETTTTNGKGFTEDEHDTKQTIEDLREGIQFKFDCLIAARTESQMDTPTDD